MKTYPELTLTGGTVVYPSSVIFKFPFKMQGKIVKRILTVKQWLELKEAEIYQKWYNENVANSVKSVDIPDEILNLKTLTPKGQTKPLKAKWSVEKAIDLEKWLSKDDDGL